MSGIQSKITRHTKRQGQEKKYTIETDTEMIQTPELSDTECKITMIDMFKKIDDKVENFIRELKSMYYNKAKYKF